MNTLAPAPTDSPEVRQARRAALAVGVAPPAVLACLIAIVADLVEPETGLAVFVLCAAWLIYEMLRYQRALDPEVEPDAARPPPA